MSNIEEYIIINKFYINHDVFILKIQPNIGIVPDIPVSSFVYFFTDDQETKRPYTPISVTKTYLEFAIKVYKNGILTQFLKEKNINDTIKVSHPIKKQEYTPNAYKDILLIAGGTGITPMLQILEKSQSMNDKTRFTLFFCNLTISDIFLKEKLEKLNVKVYHVIENMEELKNNKNIENNIDKFYGGRINKEIIKEVAFLENEKLYDFVYVCGPPGMMEAVCGSKTKDALQGELCGFLKELGFKQNEVYKL